MRREIDMQIRDAMLGRRDRRAPSPECANPRDELAKGERLDQVVVSACLEPEHAIVDRIARRQHEDRSGDASRTNPCAELESRSIRKHHVEHDHVIVSERGALASLTRIGGDCDGKALFAHAGNHDLRQRPVVFNEEHAHDDMLNANGAIGYCPNTSSTKLSGRMGGRRRGFSGVAWAGTGPNFAVTVKSRCEAPSSSIVRAPGAVVTVCTTENLSGLSSCTTVIDPSPFDENASPVPGS